MAKRKKSVEKIEGIEITPNRMENEKTTITWFPGHMAKSIKKIQEKIKMVDIVLDIRDARIPLISGNAKLRQVIGQKNTLIIINKSSLSDPQTNQLWQKWFTDQGIPHIFINSLDLKHVTKIITMAKELVLEKKSKQKATRKTRMMFLGLPNTGKSTLINRLAGRVAARAADKPGLTQVQQWINVSDTVELLDTPGVMPPRIKNNKEAYYLCAIHAIKDTIIGEEEVATFILQYLLNNKANALKEKYAINNFDITPLEAMQEIGLYRKCIQKKGEIDFDRVFRIILNDFRAGDLGRWSFESPPAKTDKKIDI